MLEEGQTSMALDFEIIEPEIADKDNTFATAVSKGHAPVTQEEYLGRNEFVEWLDDKIQQTIVILISLKKAKSSVGLVSVFDRFTDGSVNQLDRFWKRSRYSDEKRKMSRSNR